MAIARDLQPQDTRLVPRRDFAEVETILPVPNLIEIQRESFAWFVREGLKELFAEISPIQDFTSNKLDLLFVDYEFDEPKYTETECRERDFTYSAPLRIRVQLKIKETGELKEQTIYMGDFPMMTEQGTFIINGAERVVVSQLVRSPGVYFTREIDPTSGRALCYAKLIPSRGAWLEFETSNKDVISVKVDRKRKLPVTILLRAIGYGSDDELLELFENSAVGDRDYIRETIQRDPTKSQDEALLEFYRRLRPGDPPTADNARNLIQSLFFNFRRYDLGKVGRYKLNQRLGQQIPEIQRVLTKEDIIRIIEVIMELNNGQGHFDDIDHLGNRRIRAVGELIQGQFRVGLLRMERTVKERMSIQEPTSATPAALINIRPVVAAMKEFFGGSQLSQFMDQTNPLAELTHKRRLSALGPGGLNRDRAGVEVRDVHHSHYGRICPIETPEGANIGLIGYLASYGKINPYGFIETPYRRVKHLMPSNSPDLIGHTLRERVTDPRTNDVIAESGTVVTEELAQRLAALPERNIRVRAYASHDVSYLSATVEDEFAIAQANSILMANGEFRDDRVEVRFHQEFQTENIDQVEYMDVSPMQMVSIATALIPFVEHDEANRALMGANMQRQAVPLIQPESPDVGTGIERQVAQDSGQVVLSRVDGIITSINGRQIVITDGDGNEHEHFLRKFVRSNQGTCINQRTIVNIGDRVKRGDPLADSYSTDKGELALGRNIIVAFMSFDGGNFEDAIIISEDLVREDKFTSVHIERYDIEARETKLGPEEITRDIPNVGDDALRDLDERGIIRIGAEVRPGDILVGKITPKGETELTAEERLLRAIFGEKAREVRDTSLRVPHGERGKVVDVRIFSRENHDELPAGVNQLVRVSIAQKRKIVEGDKMAGRHGNKGVVSRILPIEDMPFLPDGRPVEIILNPIGVPSRMNVGQILETHLGWAAMALGMKVATPVFDGAREEDIQGLLDQAGLPPDGKTVLIDGKTGEPFDQRVTVGNMYMLKLIHQVEDKVHARSTGPYSLITQQPLGGKAQFGGQRLGEMEVWALEAYGAAHILQEMLTVKSDDVQGRVHTYEAIVKGENIVEPGVPESFKVLVKELQSLGLAVEVLNEDEAPIQFVTEDTSEEGPNERSLGINLSGRELTDFE